MSADLKIKGLDEVKKRVDPSVYKPKLKETMGQVVLFLASYVQSQKLSGQVLHIRTNRLKSSIQGTTNDDGQSLEGKVGTNVIYARIHEYGGEIKAKNSPLLRFKIGDQWISKKKVTMPERPYLRPSLQENKEFIVQRFSKSVKSILEGKEQ
jgi:phage gpG-like protein